MNSKARFTVVMIFCLGLMMGHLLHRPASRFDVDSRVDTWHYFQQDDKEYRTNDRTSEIQEISDGLWTNSRELVQNAAAEQDATAKIMLDDVRIDVELGKANSRLLRDNAALERTEAELHYRIDTVPVPEAPENITEPPARFQLLPTISRH